MKLSFNLDPKEQVREVISYRKIKQTSYPTLRFNDKSIKLRLFQKNVRLYRDSKLEFLTGKIFKICLKNQTKKSTYYINYKGNKLTLH